MFITTPHYWVLSQADVRSFYGVGVHEFFVTVQNTGDLVLIKHLRMPSKNNPHQGISKRKGQFQGKVIEVAQQRVYFPSQNSLEREEVLQDMKSN